ncbi:hypothetical protein FHR47_001243 [Xanthomonas arboricola]|uniref:hypothetical protein n=1 Tax=Xanthomonas TaxID=338 RepID=UPI0011C47816|nr:MULTISPECIES: hypothetical protein [Xanthomonas]MBB3801009.1 hypothetical protein [Xanthomonas cannabis]MBB3804529.1 hypothetical protein [Xanthomonas cannabis]NIK00471.1 hypothetical protein [Xanthomonas cannabis]NIK63397.1 hypothetical protein [Xanthomonas cannabis]
MRATCAISTLFVLIAAPATASSTMCTFTSQSGNPANDLEFLGYGKIQQILVHLPGSDGAKSLPSGSYHVIEFEEKTRTINLSYRNPGNPQLLPSFTLKGVGKKTSMWTAGKTITGEFSCDH